MSTQVLRCAIYTRVSSDAGLEQDFNSLDAQRESAEAYIRSEAHEGWKLVRERFDDGGYSGGSVDRPALQSLLQRIRERRIDIVVVYKVDRLTRSLADFAKLVELFDAEKVSFVSVTQSFNTTSSMGRLTLNVLLSFAQFEREVTGERIRDKIAASKKKGMWMGGVVPLGYRVENRKLVVVEEEAALVRSIFDLYLAHGSIRTVQRVLRERDVRTRERVLSTGEKIGAVFFTNGPLARILTNRHYIGEINHKETSWPGEHLPIVDRDIFDRVQQRLSEQRRTLFDVREKSGALLAGILFNEVGERLTPSFAVKKGVRYRYYISVSAMQSRERDGSSVHRVPAAPIEALVLETLKRALAAASPAGEEEPTRSMRPESSPAASIAISGCSAQDRALIADHVERVTVHRDRVVISPRQDTLTRPLTIPWTKPSQTRRRELMVPEGEHQRALPLAANERKRLVRAINLGRSWLDELIAGAVPDVAALASGDNRSERSTRMILSLAMLDPLLIKAAAEGRLPRGHGVTRLADLPPAFPDQWRALGLERPL